MAYPHKCRGHPSATSRAQDSESTSAKDQCSTAGPRNQLTLTNLYNANKPTCVCVSMCVSFHSDCVRGVREGKRVVCDRRHADASGQLSGPEDGRRSQAGRQALPGCTAAVLSLDVELSFIVSFRCCWSSNRKRVQPGKSHASTSRKVFSKLLLIIHSFPF